MIAPKMCGASSNTFQPHKITEVIFIISGTPTINNGLTSQILPESRELGAFLCIIILLLCSPIAYSLMHAAVVQERCFTFLVLLVVFEVEVHLVLPAAIPYNKK